MPSSSLSEPGFDLSDRGVAGRPAPPPVDVFVSTERGAYRPGETVFATVLARDDRARAIEGLTLTAIVTRADGVEYGRFPLPDQGAGGRTLAFPVGAGAPTGGWRLAIHADPAAAPLAAVAFLVEDFVPERVDLALTLPDGAIDPAAPPTLAARADFLWGAPGADLALEGETRIATARELSGRAGLPLRPRGRALRLGLRRPRSGHHRRERYGDDPAHACRRPGRSADRCPDRDAPGPRRLRSAGRAQPRPAAPARRAAHRRAPALRRRRRRGRDRRLRGDRPRSRPRAGGPRRRELDAVARRHRLPVVRGRRRLELRARHPPVPVANGAVDLAAGGPVRLDTAVDWGRYELSLAASDGRYIATSVGFDAGWGAAAAGSETPDFLALSLDRERYAPGDTARARIVVPNPGQLARRRAWATGWSRRRSLAVEAGDTVVDLPVTDDWGAGAYVTATLVRPMDVAAGRNPARAIGLAWAPVDPGTRRLAVAFEGPGEARPRATTEAVLKIDGLAAGARAWATIAAVDVGILNLTGFEAPDPDGHYFGQRRLGVEMRDVYGRLIDGLQGTPGRLRSGGDAGLGFRAPPPTEELVAIFSGVLEADAEGRVRAPIDLPDFNGTVRLMAVAWTADGVGQASKDWLVRDPVVVQASLPRFLAPGDRTRLRLDLAHATGPGGAGRGLAHRVRPGPASAGRRRSPARSTRTAA